MPAEPPDVAKGDAITADIFNQVKHAAFRKIMGANLRTGPDGTTVITPPAKKGIALFKLVENFNQTALPSGQASPLQPAVAWYHAKAQRVIYWPTAPRGPWWNTQDDEGQTVTPEETTYVWHQAGYQLDSVDPDRNMPDAMLTYFGGQQFMPGYGAGTWVWCMWDDGPQCWVVVSHFEDIIRVQLTTDFYAWSTASAAILISATNADGTTNDGTTSPAPITPSPTSTISFNTGYEVTMYDPLGQLMNDLAAIPTGTTRYIPADTILWAKRFADTNAWEVLKSQPVGCIMPCPPPTGCYYLQTFTGTPVWTPCPNSDSKKSDSMVTTGSKGPDTSILSSLTLPPVPTDASEEKPYMLVSTGGSWKPVPMTKQT